MTELEPWSTRLWRPPLKSSWSMLNFVQLTPSLANHLTESWAPAFSPPRFGTDDLSNPLIFIMSLGAPVGPEPLAHHLTATQGILRTRIPASRTPGLLLFSLPNLGSQEETGLGARHLGSREGTTIGRVLSPPLGRAQPSLQPGPRVRTSAARRYGALGPGCGRGWWGGPRELRVGRWSQRLI